MLAVEAANHRTNRRAAPPSPPSVSPGQTEPPVAAAARTVILNFHGTGRVRRAVEPGELNCWLESDQLEGTLQMAQCAPHVQFTVDDGNASDFEVILPVLLRLQQTATFFVCSSRLDQPHFLSRSQVRELQACGMHIGSHGHRHQSWRTLADGKLAQELSTSRKQLEDVCGRPVDTAACPFGAYDRRVLAHLRAAGFRTVYTSDGGTARRADWLQPRVTVTRLTSRPELLRLIQFGPTLAESAVLALKTVYKRLR